MKYLTHLTVNKPIDIDPEKWSDILANEKKYGDTIDGSKFEHMWRVVGKYSTYCVFNVEDNDELHAILSGLPLFPYMEVEVIPLATYAAE